MESSSLQPPKLRFEGHEMAGRGEIYKCAECNKRFASLSQLEAHMMSHIGLESVDVAKPEPSVKKKRNREDGADQTPYLCMMCPRRFTAPGYLKKHLRTHVDCVGNQKRHRCSFCGTCFARKSTLDNHVRIHTGDRPYVCHLCGKNYKHSAGLWLHTRTHEGISRHHRSQRLADSRQPVIYTCEVCSKVYLTASGLTWHRRTQHSPTTDEVPVRFQCSDCGQSYGSLRYLKVHKLTHSGVKRYACPVCGQLYITCSRMTAHLRTHSDEKRYGCVECGRLFKQRRGLMTHLRRHTGFHPFVCTVCGKQFISEGGIRYHNRIHARTASDPKPHGCADCGKRFLSLDGLKYHRRLHQTQTADVLTESSLSAKSE